MEKKITKKDLVDVVLSLNEGMTKKAAKETVDAIFDTITKNVKKKNTVDINGFGKFVVKARKARTGVNPLTGEKVKIAAKKVPAFKPAKAFKDLFVK